MKRHEKSEAKGQISRRTFVRDAAAVAGGLMIIPSHVLGRGGKAPSEKLNIAAIGVAYE